MAISTDSFLAALEGGPMTYEQLAKALGVDRHQVGHTARKLKAAKRVVVSYRRQLGNEMNMGSWMVKSRQTIAVVALPESGSVS